MKNDKRNVHTSGALGKLLESKQITEATAHTPSLEKNNENSRGIIATFVTKNGLVFKEDELFYIHPSECEPWKYANRMDDELGNIEELVESIKKQGQLQPALVRYHPAPHGNIKYEVIFGRRRYLACLELNRPLMVINKNLNDVKEAIAIQDAENKERKNVSNYSNSILYKRLLEDGVFLTEKELASEVGMSTSSFNDLMAYSKIPEEIISLVPDVHSMSTAMALKIQFLAKKSPDYYIKLVELAPLIGVTITTPIKLEKMMEKSSLDVLEEKNYKTQVYQAANGEKLFTFKINHRGNSSILINKNLTDKLSGQVICEHLMKFLESELQNLAVEYKSGAPD